MKRLFTFLMATLIALSAISQNGAQKYLGDNMAEFTDSIEDVQYPYILPIMGGKVTKKGFKLPLPHGINPIFVRSVQDILLEDMQIAFNDGEFIDISDFVRFESVRAAANTFNVRFDTYVLPFFNVYTIAGYVWSSSDIKVGLPVQLNAVSNNAGPYVGIGGNISAGVGPLFLSVDASHTWAFLEVLDEPNRVFVLGLRLGHNHTFRKNPERGFAIWGGTQLQRLAADTRGAVQLDDVFDIPDRQGLVEQLDEWYGGLNPLQQEFLAPVYETFIDYLENNEPLTVRYQQNKRLANPWSMAIGAQYRFSSRWQFRSEVNFLGSRNQIMFGLNYRFGIRGEEFKLGKRVK